MYNKIGKNQDAKLNEEIKQLTDRVENQAAMCETLK